MDHLPLMARFNAWANERICGSAERLSDDVYRKDQGAFFGSIHRTLNHLLVVDRLWTGRIEGVDRGVTGLDQVLFDDFEELRRARLAEDQHLIALVDGLTGREADDMVTYSRIRGDGAQKTRCSHILITLFNHQTHHRGQVHCMLTQSGVTPPPLDIIFFLEEVGLS